MRLRVPACERPCARARRSTYLSVTRVRCDVSFETELLLPMLVIVMMLSLGKSREMQSLASTLYSALWILVIIDVTWLSIRLVGELKRRFPEHNRKGWWFYAIMRALQLRPLRMPKPQVKMFTKLP